MIPNNLNLVKANEIVKQFHIEKESDRAAAILAAAYVEQCLEEFIWLFIIEQPKIAADKLLNNYSVSTFNNRINFAYVCNWITEDIKKTCIQSAKLETNSLIIQTRTNFRKHLTANIFKISQEYMNLKT